jgi:hypothetical protein
LSTAEVRITAPADLTAFAYARSYPIFASPDASGNPVRSREIPYHGDVACLDVELPGGPLTYRNPTLDRGIANTYLSSVALATLDFVRAVRGDSQPEFSSREALIAMEIEAGCRRSAELQGVRVDLPLSTEPAFDARYLEALHKKYGVDPLDVDAMIDVAFPKTYVS